MKHPAEYYIKYLILDDLTRTDATILYTIQEEGFLTPAQDYLGFLRQQLIPPEGFDPRQGTHRPSTKFLREQGVYEMFYPGPAIKEAQMILRDLQYRLAVEQALMGRIPPSRIASELNRTNGWMLTEEGIRQFYHFYWNVKLLNFDDWGRFLYGRTAMYERHMALLTAPESLTFHHLRVAQVVDSKSMIEQVQKHMYFTFVELAQKPGTDQAKVKGMAMLGKGIIDCHEAMSTSDMALKDVLKNFERFRMAHPQPQPRSIQELAPGGNYTGSGTSTETEGEPHVA